MNIADLKSKIDQGYSPDCDDFCSVFCGGVSYLDALKLAKLFARNQADNSADLEQVRIGLTGTGTLDYLDSLLTLSGPFFGFELDIVTSAYNNYVSDLMDEESVLHRSDIDCLIFVNDSRLIGEMAHWGQSADQVSEVISANLDSLTSLLNPFVARGVEVFVLNTIPDSALAPGDLRLKIAGSNLNICQAWNDQLVNQSAGFNVVDVAFTAMKFGIDNALDVRQWLESKLPFSMDFHPRVVAQLWQHVQSRKNADKKVIVLDCDNTLWGGVVGDDGLSGIEVGTLTARAQGYAELQRQLKKLKNAGVLLAVCSKNEEATVLEVFRNHEEMVLREEDIVTFRVNWDSKADNIGGIAQELNLGLDSFVFVDDNPAELEIVRRYLPEVVTIQASLDPVETLKLVSSHASLFRSSITQEDASKTEQYRSDHKRNALQSKVTNFDEYLESLEMIAVIDPVSAASAARASQLINKSNQFNLTTVRRSENDVMSIAQNDDWFTFTIRLRDKFGDHGIICVVFAEKTRQSLVIETFVMSCRVLKRGVEQLVVNQLVDIAFKNNCLEIQGIYRPTAKNSLVKELYVELGFSVDTESDKETRYRLDLNNFEKRTTYIGAAES